MPKLSEQQIKRALDAIDDEYDERKVIEKIAPLVQFKWEPITDDESLAYQYADRGLTPRGQAIAWINSFIAKRNAALLPPPVDPRREKIAKVIFNSELRLKPNSQQCSPNDMADAILAALDNTQSRMETL